MYRLHTCIYQALTPSQLEHAQGVMTVAGVSVELCNEGLQLFVLRSHVSVRHYLPNTVSK